MPKQVVKTTTAVHHEPGSASDWLDQQGSFSSPTEGASSDASDSTVDLKHNELLGLHKNGKSVAPDAISDFAKPLSRRTLTTSGRDVAGTTGTEAGYQRDYDSAGIDREPKTVKPSAKGRR
jgi:hypothetical protein